MATGAPGEMIESSLGPKYQFSLSRIMLPRRISILDMGEFRVVKFSERLYRRLKLKNPDCDSILDNPSSALVPEALENNDDTVAKALLTSCCNGTNYAAIQTSGEKKIDYTEYQT